MIKKNKPPILEIIDEIFLVKFLAYFNYNQYINSFKLNGNEKILELGCGSGNISRFIIKKLSNKGFLTCVDIFEYWISKIKKRLEKYNNIEFKLGDIKKLNIKDSFYDIVVIHYVLHDITESERLDLIKIIKKKLKKGGKFYIREPIRKSHGISPGNIKRLMKLSGLKEVYSKNKFSLLLRSTFEGIFVNV
ncbi:MAG: class I SAM-dependent methyltransferase [Candidatus Nanoarchaeia archaeon]|nr:class I SAM-dependent methyltransferase [Candidatus Nanoarchaeia archaeon]MDD5587941.1 class I SAM-dependent methyltransferase [Candidatus Nanoarchaeia archaeon]